MNDLPYETELELSLLRLQLGTAKASLAKALEEATFLKDRLILHQVERAFSKAGGNPEIESDRVRGLLGIFGDIELVGGEAGFRQKESKELATLTEGIDLLKKSSTFAPLFAPQSAASEQKIFKNEFGSFRRI